MVKKQIGGLQRYSKEEKKKFDGSKPLIKYLSDYYPDRFCMEYHEFETPKDFMLIDFIQGKKVELNNKIPTFGIDTTEEEFTQYDFLDSPEGTSFIVHKRILEVLSRECPDDFQKIPIIIKNLNSKSKKFENKDYCLINLLNKIDALDKSKIKTWTSPNGVEYVEKRFYRDDALGDHLMVIDDMTLHILFHPKLAKLFMKSRGVKFVTDEESNY